MGWLNRLRGADLWHSIYPKSGSRMIAADSGIWPGCTRARQLTAHPAGEQPLIERRGNEFVKRNETRGCTILSLEIPRPSVRRESAMRPLFTLESALPRVGTSYSRR
jgi:hypothetical protein